ncbi:MAG: phosphatidate cytidylyltransferase [Armatimonadetes bacterium]|nr:phosphatidate cytidylyltransferase [Armatimonadota bacterium]
MVDRPRRWGDRSLLPRIATIVIGAPVLIAAVVRGGPALLAVVLLLTAVGAMEFRRLALAVGYQASLLLPAGALLFPLLAYAGRWEHAGVATSVLVIAAAGAALTSSRRGGAPASAAVDTLGALYVGALFAHLLLLREDAGYAVTLAVLGLIWANDIAAYFVGSRWGRQKLAPAISPGKSVEGCIGGLAAAVVVAVVIATRLGWPAVSFGVIGVCVAAAGVIGDLSKSTMKRAAGMKDAGAILPGHGGVLDRFDAVLFGVPVGYYLWRWLP